jgi:hypothetical protein
MTVTESGPHAPVDAINERLNDPAVAASLVTLLDNAEFLSTLVLGLGGFVARGETIMDALADGVQEFKTASGSSAGDQQGLPSVSELTGLAGQLSTAGPTLQRVLDSPMTDEATIDLLGLLSEAAGEGLEQARANDTKVTGPLNLVRSMKDPEIQRGLGVVMEIARSLGKRV